MSVKVKDLGKCYRKSEDGFYRLYKVNGSWAIYCVSGSEAVLCDDDLDPLDFEYRVILLEEETSYLVAEAKAEFGF